MSTAVSGTQLRMQPDGWGYNGCLWPTPTPPAGSNRAVYVIRFWMTDTLSGETQYLEDVSLWSRAQFFGFVFDGTWPDGNAVDQNTNPIDVDDFFGAALEMSGGDEDTVGLSKTGGVEGATSVVPYAAPGLGYNNRFFDGNGTAATLAAQSGTSVADNVKPLFSIPLGEDGGSYKAFVWQAVGSEADESVSFSAWISEAPGIDFASFDIANDLTIENPKTEFPVKGSLETSTFTINGAAETGTNWRPSAGTMGFPGHFACSSPFADINATPLPPELVIDYLGVAYGQPA